MTTDTAALVARLRALDLYLNNLWSRAATLRDKHTGQAHADLNDLRHAIGAIDDVLIPAAQALEALSAPAPDGEVAGVRVVDAYLQALLDYSGAFYAVAIDRGIPAKDAANAMHHIERAARNLHAIAALPRGGEAMREALQKCEAQFRFYAENHRAKGTPDADEKAATNDTMADLCRAALTTEPR